MQGTTPKCAVLPVGHVVNQYCLRRLLFKEFRLGQVGRVVHITINTALRAFHATHESNFYPPSLQSTSKFVWLADNRYPLGPLL